MKLKMMVCAALITSTLNTYASDTSSQEYHYGYQGSDTQGHWGIIEGLEFDEQVELYPDMLPDYIKVLYTKDNKISFDTRWTFSSIYGMYPDVWDAYPNTDTEKGRQEALYDIRNNVACQTAFKATQAADYADSDADGEVANLEMESCLQDGSLKNYRMRTYIPTTPGATYAFEFKYRQVTPIDDSGSAGLCQQYHASHGYGLYHNLYNYFSGLNRHWDTNGWNKPWCKNDDDNSSSSDNDVLTGRIDFSGYGRNFYRLYQDNVLVKAKGFVWPGSAHLGWGYVNRSYSGLGVRSRASNGYFLSNEVDYRFARQRGVSERLSFDLLENISYQAEIEFSHFYAQEQEKGIAEFYRNGIKVSSQPFASNSAGGQYKKAFDVVENGFDRIVIKASNNGNPYWRGDNSDLTVRAITFSDKASEAPNLFVNIDWSLNYLTTEVEPDETLDQGFKTETLFVKASKYYTSLTVNKEHLHNSNEVLLRSIAVTEFASNPRQAQCEEVYPIKGDAQTFCLTGDKAPELFGCDLSQAVIAWSKGVSDTNHGDPNRSTKENILHSDNDKFLSLGKAGNVELRLREQGHISACPVFGKALSFNEVSSTQFNEVGLVRVTLTRCENKELNSGQILLTNDLDSGAKIFNAEQPFSFSFGEGFEGCAISQIKIEDALNVYWSGALDPYDGDGVDINAITLE
ncbi:hypothetical protein [Vibrio genomosp. F10]|uniref:Uncharacterized protein n=1 Tax=Vibrio genomosp. F10 str. ZF-129 TaxID=1187848 RepID=A0A1E5B9J6_9VIBR|nr:hypothetical protein [Vibrio genomosp. F10]OEE30587.1 hypothetical protein A1QO_14745 [Vibrio genomosp. F10 str. ZF-129]OEE86172.1 hypothetical protein A1QK_19820 [Vibrio genomosp. F10 str. 9ZD137]